MGPLSAGTGLPKQTCSPSLPSGPHCSLSSSRPGRANRDDEVFTTSGFSGKLLGSGKDQLADPRVLQEGVLDQPAPFTDLVQPQHYPHTAEESPAGHSHDGSPTTFAPGQGREADPTALIIDSQSVRALPAAQLRRCDYERLPVRHEIGGKWWMTMSRSLARTNTRQQHLKWSVCSWVRMASSVSGLVTAFRNALWKCSLAALCTDSYDGLRAAPAVRGE